MKHFLISALLCSALVACESDAGLSPEDANAAISFTSNTSTRATDTSFEESDAISVAAYTSDGTAYAEDVIYRYSEGTFTSDDPIKYSTSNQELSFRALYPYVIVGGDNEASFAVKTDQSSGTNYTLSDLLAGYSEVTSSTTPALSFNHLLSKIVITVSESDVEITEISASLYVLGSVKYNTETKSLTTTTGDTTTIKMASNGTNSFKAIIAPQTISSSETLGTITIDGTAYDFYYASDFEIEAGKEYTIKAKMEDGKIFFYNPETGDWNHNDEAEYLDDDDEESRTVYYFSQLQATDDYKSLTTNAQFTKAITDIPEGSILQLEEGVTYTLTSDLSITKGIIFRGVGETPTPDFYNASSLKDVTGASSDLTTTIKLSSSAASLIVKADDVKFKHLRIEGGGVGVSSGNLIEINGIRYNLKLENVHIWGGGYHLSPRNHMSPALECRYVTFEDFHNRAFFINRIYETYSWETPDGASYADTNYTKLDKCLFYRCYFKVYEPTTSDTRAISLDAGNTENPDILDFDGLEVKECYFHDIGIASSKCRNFDIIDCEFYVKDLFDFPLHLEEYTREVLLSNCLFDCDNSEEIMIGAFDDSVVEKCTVKGSCYGFIQGRYAEGMVIRNNDISQMTNINPSTSPRAISLWDSVGSRDITVTGNNMSGEIYIQATSENQSSINISNNGAATTNIKTTTGYDYPLEDGATCRIKSYYNSLYLAATGANANVVTTSAEDESSLWEVTQVWPNRYNAYNAKYDTYLYIEEDAEAYTAEEALARCIILETMRFDAANERLPIWDFTVQANGYSIVGPGGGNDGCVGIVGSNIQCLKYADERDDSEVTDERCLWSLVEVK
ncbi:MAG: fimbrillin family protein [Rikenellaceae bacterium]